MRTLDRISIRAAAERVFELARRVERWPEFLPHYRWVRDLEPAPAAGARLVEMAAWRPFGPLMYPTWWVSEMTVHPEDRMVRYRHVRGITAGMNVEWRLSGDAGPTVEVSIEHRWDGPRWPLIGRASAELVIGPVFIHGIASRTLAGIKREAERG